MRRGIRSLIVAFGLVGWCAAAVPAPPALRSPAPWWCPVARAAASGQSEAQPAGEPAGQPQQQDLAAQPGSGDRPSDIELAQYSRVAAWVAAAFGLLAFVFLVAALISRRIRRRRRVRRHSVYGVELPRNRISG